MCTIKSWLPPEGSQHKLKEAGPCRKPNKGQLGWFFFLTYRLSGAAWSRACWTWGSPDTVSLTACFVPRISTEFSFLFLPSVNQKKKGERLRASQSAPAAGEGGPWLIGVLTPGQFAALRPGSEPGHRSMEQARRAHVSTQSCETLASLLQKWVSWFDGVWLALI